MVFGALLVLTLITVGVSYLDLPEVETVVVALIIATTKASLVAMFFMHLKGERPHGDVAAGADGVPVRRAAGVAARQRSPITCSGRDSRIRFRASATRDFLMACPVCFGGEDTLMRESLNTGIGVLMGVTAIVLAFFARFIFTLVKRSQLGGRESFVEDTLPDRIEGVLNK